MVDIRPNALPDAILPLRTGDELIVDQGTDGVRKVDPFALTDSTAPVSTQSEAQVGTDNVKRMTPLRTKQSIASEVGISIASNAQGTKADSAVQSVNGKAGNTITITKADVGLGNVDNTSDANKPISTATQNALDAKANSSVTISAGSGLTGGGNLTANRTVSLNAASIASLAKADSSVQTVNGVSPTGGNVTVSAEEKRLQDTRTAAIAESFGSNVLFVETAGYSSVGDGGGALYKRVSTEPSHIGKFQSADGAWWEIVLSDELDIRQFGGKLNDDAFDNAPILEQVLKLGTVGIPANSFLNCLSSVDVSNIHTVIVGASTATSEIRFTGSVNGFTAIHDNSPGGTPPYLFTLIDLALTTTNDPALTQNTAVNITWHKGFTAERFMTHGTCQRVDFRGVNTEQMGWGTCFKGDNILNYNFIDTIFNGKDEGGAMNQAVAGKTRSQFGVYLSGGWVPCEIHLVSCQAYHINTAVYTTGSFEGLYLVDCAFVSVGTGIDQVATTFDPDWPGSGGVPVSAVGRPWITVKGTHMNVYRRAIASNGVVQGSVELNALYHSDGAEEDGVLVTIQNGHDWNIRGNIFRSYAKNALVGTGVLVGLNADHVNIVDNNFETKGIGIWVQSSSNGKNRERNNTFKGSYSVSAIYEEAPNKIAYGPRSVVLYCTDPYNVPNGGSTIPWDTIGHIDVGTFSAGGTSWDVPSYSGIKRIKVTAGTNMDANNTGARQLQIRKNGAQAYVGAAMSPTILGSTGGSLNVTSGILDVAEGDQISLYIYQDSGGGLNAQGGGLTWMNIEVVE